MDRIFADTSAWYAFINRRDPNHKAVKAVMQAWEGHLVFTDYVFDEILTLVRSRAGHGLAVQVGSLLRTGEGGLLVRVESQDTEDAWAQFCRDADKDYSFTDCCSFAVMRRLKVTQAVAVDDHFRQAGFVVLPDVA